MKNSKFTELFEKDLIFKNYSQNTIKNYVSQVDLFLRYFKDKDSPKHISAEEIKDYLIGSNCINSQRNSHSAVKCFYKYTVKQPFKFRFLEYARKEKKLPQVIDKEFLLDKISKIENLKHKSIISLAFSTGMRVSEVINLKLKDVDSKRMIIHVKNAKGGKDRIVPLSKGVLDLLREYYLQFKPKTFLFNGQNSLQYSSTSCNQIVKKYLGKQYHFHLLRHSSFTSMLESGTDLRVIQSVAGHRSSRTTEIYTHVSKLLINQINTPL
jgi:site-specific recombinase XerD